MSLTVCRSSYSSSEYRLRESAGMSERARLGLGTAVVPTNQGGTIADVGGEAEGGGDCVPELLPQGRVSRNFRAPRDIRGRKYHRRPRRDAIAILQLRAWMYAWMHVLPRYQKPLVTGHVADLPHTASGGTPAHRRNDERNPSLVRPRALGLEHRRCRYAYGALRHFAKRISAVPRIPATTAGANEVSAQWNNRLLEQGRQVSSSTRL